MLESKVRIETGKDKAFTVNMLNMVEECKMSEITSVVRRTCQEVTNYAADYCAFDLETLISSNIL